MVFVKRFEAIIRLRISLGGFRLLGEGFSGDIMVGSY